MIFSYASDGAGMYVGSMLGLGASPSMIAGYGWPSVFYFFGCLGIVWYVFWSYRASSTPNEDPRISDGEKAYIVANAVSKVRATSFSGPFRVIEMPL